MLWICCQRLLALLSKAEIGGETPSSLEWFANSSGSTSDSDTSDSSGVNDFKISIKLLWFSNPLVEDVPKD